MKKRIAMKWIKALRSGEYAQARGFLVNVDSHGNESFCCLGVLCNLATEAGYGQWQGTSFVDDLSEGNDAILPNGVVKWAGMKDPTGELPIACKTSSLTKNAKYLTVLNDKGATHSEIADLIETYWEQL